MPEIEMRGLRKTFPNGHTALADVTFEVPQGQFVCIVGRSGAGKSTLMRCLNGSLPLTAGHAIVGDFTLEALSRNDRRALQRSVGFIYQEFYLVGRLSALRNVLTGRLGYVPTWRAVAGFFRREDRRLALEALERVSMLHKAQQRADSLSGGEKQRIAIARALAQRPRLLLADEPVANLDPELAEDVLRDLRGAAKDLGVTTLLNIHNVGQARKFADRIVGIAQGRVVFDGPPADFGRPAVDAVYRFDRAPGRDLDEELEPAVVDDIAGALAAGEARDILRRLRALDDDDIASLLTQSRRERSEERAR